MDSSVTDESVVDETRVWRIYKNLVLVSMMSLFITLSLVGCLANSCNAFKIQKRVLIAVNRVLHIIYGWTNNNVNCNNVNSH